MTRSIILFLSCCCCSLSVASLRADVILVPDPDAGIETIQQALQRSYPGDEIIIAEGYYEESLNITTPSLTLRGMGNVTIQGTSQSCWYDCVEFILNEPAIVGDSVVDMKLINLRLYGGTRSESGICSYGLSDAEYPLTYTHILATTASMVLSNAALTLENCFLSSSDPYAITLMNSVMNFKNCQTSKTLSLIDSSVSIVESNMSGPEGIDGIDYSSSVLGTRFPTVGTIGSTALIVENSCLYISQSSIRGGTGGDGGDGYWIEAPGFPGARGGDAMVVKSSSRIHADASLIKGGTGGRSGAWSDYWQQKGGTGGDALILDASVLVIDAGSIIAGGDGGLPSDYRGWLPGDDGVQMVPADHPGYIVIPSMAVAIDHILGRAILSSDEIDALDLNTDGLLDVADLIIGQHPCQAWP